MAKKSDSIFEMCPIRNVVARFGNKWAILVLLVLADNGPVRFNALGKLIPDISTKVLADTLRILEADNLINRKVYPVVPVKVENSLTAIGHTLIPIIQQQTDWALANMSPITKHRDKFESGHFKQEYDTK